MLCEAPTGVAFDHKTGNIVLELTDALIPDYKCTYKLVIS